MINDRTLQNELSFNKEKTKTTFYPWLVWLLGASFFFYKYLVQVSPSVMTSELMESFHLQGAGLGNLSACYFYAYLMMQIPVGLLLDKWSPRLLTTLAILLCGLSTLVFACSHSLLLASVSRAFMGFGAAFAAVSCFKLTALWFPAKRFALVSGLCMTAAMLGAINGQMPLLYLIQAFDWRSALMIVGSLGATLSAIYYALIRDKVSTTQSEKPASSLRFGSILRNHQAWLLSLYSGLAFAPVSAFGGLWGLPFLEEAHRLSKTQAACAISFIFVGFAIGAPLWGYLSDAIKRRKPIMALGSALAALSLSLVLYSPIHHAQALNTLLLIFGLGASGFFISFAMIREVFPIALVATVLGFMNTFDTICEALTEPLVGALLDLTAKGPALSQVVHFSTQGYHWALALLPVYLVVALLILVFIKETNCQSLHLD